MMIASQFVTLASVLMVIMACKPGALGQGLPDEQSRSGVQTQISVVSSDKAVQPGIMTIVDPAGALEKVSQLVGDIDEDPNDPFITTRSGKMRPIYSGDSQWVGDMPASLDAATKDSDVLVRKKRCNNNDDDDGDARRSRRSRRARRTKSAKRAKRQQRKKNAKRAKSTSTTVTRKVIHNGQVVSETTQTQGAAGTVPTGQVLVASGQPQVVQTVPQQPIVVQQQQPAEGVPQQVVSQLPAVVSAAPSISVQNSVKIN